MARKIETAHFLKIGYCNSMDCGKVHIWFYDENMEPFTTFSIEDEDLKAVADSIMSPPKGM